MIYFDLVVRSASITLLALLCISIAGEGFNKPQRKLLFLSAFSVCCLLLGMAASYIHFPPVFFYLFRIFDVPHLVFIWLFGLSLFNSDFQIKRWHIMISILYCLPIISVRFAQFGLINEISTVAVFVANIFTIVMISHLVFSVTRAYRDDLSEKRRKARVHFVCLISFMAVLISIAEIMVVLRGLDVALLATIKALAIFPAILWTCVWLLTFKSEKLGFDHNSGCGSGFTANETKFYQRLMTELKSNRAFLEPNLSIADLAKRISTTEPKLRCFINQKLGHKNFSSFVNRFRIESIKEDFKNPEFSELPILTIALNNGFSSLSPFNRAFLRLEGTTPSQYRKSLSD